MSFNLLRTNYSRHNTEAVIQTLDDLLAQWRGAVTREERNRLEGEIVNQAERRLRGEVSLRSVQKFDRASGDSFFPAYLEARDFSDRFRVSIQRTQEDIVNLHNGTSIKLGSLIGQIRRARQKLATLQLWSDSEAKHLVAEYFANLGGLSDAHVDSNPAWVDTASASLLLPKRAEAEIKYQEISIGAGSNGLYGRSSSNPEAANSRLRDVTTDTDEWFKYERLDAGPMRLVLVARFPAAEIINRVEIYPAAAGNSGSFTVSKVTVTDSDGASVVISDPLTSDYVPEVNKVSQDTYWAMNFVPIRTRIVTVELIQNESGAVTVPTPDGRLASRKQYSVGIKHLRFSRINFAPSGEIASSGHTLPQGIYAALPVVDVRPRVPAAHDIKVGLSFDGAETWSMVDAYDPTSTLNDGVHQDFFWKLKLQRNTEAFAHLSSLREPVSLTPRVGNLMRSLSGNASPVRIVLPEKPANGEVCVLQTDLIKRGDKRDIKRFSRSKVVDQSVRLPSGKVRELDEDDIEVYTNRKRAMKEERTLGLGGWKRSRDLSEIELRSDKPNQDIQAVIKPERMHFEEAGEHYLHRTNSTLDPFMPIRIETISSRNKREARFLPSDKKVVSLGHKGVIGEQFTLEDIQGASWSSVDSRELLDPSSKEYYLDVEEGVLYFSQKPGLDTLKTVFSYNEPIEIDDFEVAYEGAKPIGVLIPRPSLESEAVTDFVGSGPAKKTDPIVGNFEAREDLFPGSLQKKVLSRQEIIKGTLNTTDLFDEDYREVDYVDGKTEFLYLLQSSETTNEVEAATGLEYVQFVLAAGSLWYRDTGIVFGDATYFNTELGSTSAVQGSSTVGDYYVADTGLVTVVVGPGGALPEGISIDYYYNSGEESDSPLFSVDYARGLLFASEDMQPGAEITYQVANYRISYTLAEEVSNYSYDKSSNSVSVHTEDLDPSSKKLRVIWKLASGTEEIQELEAYYSPIVNSVSFRCF